ncbi:hypothetical protein BDN72DRAFT_899682 [Pluteus cervinus]|uniref:Uncharacterized protein n=1 Tax=Pluteus cervinus TaxID=181527 RepID=A0ACD3AM67_9AGAR|nr:hypothetical protein BDN72DRAFT_899682 [Pluteus cervinus]
MSYNNNPQSVVVIDDSSDSDSDVVSSTSRANASASASVAFTSVNTSRYASSVAFTSVNTSRSHFSSTTPNNNGLPHSNLTATTTHLLSTAPVWSFLAVPSPTGPPMTLPTRLLGRQDMMGIPRDERWYAVIRARGVGLFYGWESVRAVRTPKIFCRIFRNPEDAWLFFMYHRQRNNVRRIP